ncbi:aldo/keto reductase [Methylopila sp. M107]|uniref:aldo/keto reductase n=1 Tax=Methylopila sp. M107 TaxID=1101190 RepID=UPI000380DD31|nr:aldo/keto reductase [Methylopila sp. M107]
MKQRPLGRTGQVVSEIGFGCMGMSEFYGPSDQSENWTTLGAALDAGVNFLDTADTYGHGANEELVGRFARTVGRHRVLIATKFGIVREPGKIERRIDSSPAYVRAACEASLKRLGVDAIDLYYAHRINPDVPIEDTVGAMADLVRAGKVRALGLSEVSPATLKRAHAVHPITAVQSELSLTERAPEDDMLPLCWELSVTFVAYSPLGRALLTGRNLSAEALDETDYRRSLPRFVGEAAAANARLAGNLKAIAAEKGATPSQIALAWLLSSFPHVVPIPGTRRPERARENARASDVRLTRDDLERLDGLFPIGATMGARYTEAGFAGVNA